MIPWRTPVAMTENAGGHFVVCDDGSVWERRAKKRADGTPFSAPVRVEFEPIPGSERDAAQVGRS